MKYSYEILNYWKDSRDLYVNYTVENVDTKEKANTIAYYNVNDLKVNYDATTDEEIREYLLKDLQRNNGYEFKKPKVSILSPLLQYVYDTVCQNESNMCHIDYDDWQELKEDYDFTEKDIDTLKKEIDKYNLDELVVVDDGEYKICGYGIIQEFFNDDRVKENDELER